MEDEPYFNEAVIALNHYCKLWLGKPLPSPPFLRYVVGERRNDLICYHFVTPESDLSGLPCDQYFVVVTFGEDFERRANELRREYAENPQHKGSTAIHVFLKEGYATVLIGNKPTANSFEQISFGRD